jgi:nitrite reductase/ring-hydroxylating ferredoxin subunit
LSDQLASATEVLVGSRSQFKDGERVFLRVASTEVGVFCHDGVFYAFENRCVHMGGPVCEGRIIGRVEAVLAEDKTVLGERFSETETHIVCPWHGYEYDLATGECAADRRLKLRRFEVVERGDEIYVQV